jgi:hypothetical protein
MGCTKCAHPYSLLNGTGKCVENCPSGFNQVGGVCVKSSGTISWDFLFDADVTSDFRNGSVSIVGGFCKESVFIDDPIPIKGRGVWLNGDIDHFTISGLTLNHSFSLEFFIRHKLENWETAALLASYQSPYDMKPGTTYSLKISQQTLMLVEHPKNVNAMCAGAEITKDEWQLVAVVVEWNRSEKTSAVTFLRNGDEISTFESVDMLITDSSSFMHYIGGVRHNWRLSQAYRGFIYAFFASNEPKTTFTDTVWKAGDCAGSCDVCTKDKICPKTCEFNEYVNGSNECVLCDPDYTCNIC